MVSSTAKTVAAYLDELPAERRAAVKAVHEVVCDNLPRGFEVAMQYGMIGYRVPLSRFPKTYNGQPLCVASLAAQKHHMSLYLMSIYGDPELQRWFEAAYRASGKKLDVGKCCVRFKSLDDLPLDIVGEAISRVGVDDFIAMYEDARNSPRRKRASKRAVKRTTKRATKKTAKRAAKPTVKARHR